MSIGKRRALAVLSDVFRAMGLLGLLAAACAAIATVDQVLAGRVFLAEGPPIYSAYFLARTLAALGLAAAAVFAVSRWNRDLLFPGLAPPLSRASLGAVAFYLAAIATAAALLALQPAVFSRMAREDSAFEWASAVLLAMASTAMLAAAAGYMRRRERLAGALSAWGGLAFFIIAMEEVSWLQRVIGYGTPESLHALNLQEEFNLHNIATNLSENIYYGGTFLLLVIAPSMAFLFRPSGPLTALAVLLPGRHALILGAMTSTFAYGMWNIFWMQAAFFYGVLILLILAGEAARQGAGAEAVLYGAASGLLALCQFAVLEFGPGMVRDWEDTEFRELIIAAALLTYGGEVWLRSRDRGLAPSRHVSRVT